jgi:hypothetical protein
VWSEVLYLVAQGRRFRSRKALADGPCVSVHARTHEFTRLLRGTGGFFDNMQNGSMECWSVGTGAESLLGRAPHVRSSRRKEAQTRTPARVEARKWARNYNRFKVESTLVNPRSHLINERGWRDERFWPAARRDAGRIPAAGCNRGTTTQPAKRSTALDLFSEHMYPPSDKFKVPNAAAGIYEMASSQTKIISLAAGPRSAGARVCDPQQAGA